MNIQKIPLGSEGLNRYLSKVVGFGKQQLNYRGDIYFEVINIINKGKCWIFINPLRYAFLNSLHIWKFSSLFKYQYRIPLKGRAQTNLAKLLLAKALLLKLARTCFLLLKIRLAHTNRAKSKSIFEHVLALATSKMPFAKTSQNVLESIFAFCSIHVRQVIILTKESTF